MDAPAPRGLLVAFASIPDPRVLRTQRHRLIDIMVLSVLAVICGAQGPTEIQDFGRAKYQWLKTFLPLPNGIPSHDTIGRVLAALDPDAFESCLIDLTDALARTSGTKALHIDGKTLRRSFDRAAEKTAVHMVNVWASQAQLVLAQQATDAKSNEITAIPGVLDLLCLPEAVVTIDAMGCQRAIAQRIIDGQGDYLLAVKDNQPALYASVKELFDEAIAHDFEGMGYDRFEATEKGHGRIETRRVWVTREAQVLPEAKAWPKLRGAVCVEGRREVLDPSGGPSRVSVERRYFITSVDHRDRGKDAQWFGGLVRSHWGIENQLHWCLDVGFREDESRVRQGCLAENFSRLNRLALNLLKQEKASRRGIAGKRKNCGWDHEYLLKVIGLTN